MIFWCSLMLSSFRPVKSVQKQILYKAEFYDEAAEQCEAAMKITDRSIFIFYYTAALFALGRSKEAMLQLEKGMEKSPKLLKKLVELNPSVLQNSQVVDLIARYKKGRKI